MGRDLLLWLDPKAPASLNNDRAATRVIARADDELQAAGLPPGTAAKAIGAIYAAVQADSEFGGSYHDMEKLMLAAGMIPARPGLRTGYVEPTGNRARAIVEALHANGQGSAEDVAA